MSIPVFQVGHVARCSATFEDVNGDAVDPSGGVEFRWRVGSGPVVELTYQGSPGGITRDADGQYHVDISCAVPGLYRYRFVSTGTGQTAGEGEFLVEASKLD